MKKILTILSVTLITCLIPAAFLNGQDTKAEKKIKIIIDDGSGKKVIVDTLLKGDSDIETIKLDDGKMIFISSPDGTHGHNGSKHVTVTVTSDDESGDKVTGTNTRNNMTAWATTDAEGDEEKVIVVKKTGSDLHPDKNVEVYVATDVNQSSVDKSRFVVAKDGIVVTVEGEDEEKAREIMNVIEDHLGVKSKGEDKEVNSETKKSSRK